MSILNPITRTALRAPRAVWAQMSLCVGILHETLNKLFGTCFFILYNLHDMLGSADIEADRASVAFHGDRGGGIL